MENIKAYNVKELVEKQDFDGKKLTTFDYSNLAIIEGNKGVFAFDEEGVGYLKNNRDEEITIGLNDIPKEGMFHVTAKYQIDISLDEIIKTAVCKEMNLIEFIERYDYNDRLRRNFHIVLKTIDDIGLNSENYYVE